MFLSERCVWPYAYRRGSSALIVSMPHVGTFVPHSVGAALHDCAALRADTDWHLPRLYDFLGELDATVVAARFSRYVIDVNRPPDGANLYPGRDTPKLCPGDTFDRQPLYRTAEPGTGEVERRLDSIWRPYHARLAREIDRVVSRHGIAILWDAHSIVSVAPRLFDGRLADFNLGTAGGASCDPGLARSLLEAFGAHSRYTSVLDGRFKGGHITRAYGDPARNVHAIQLEMAEATYMDETPPYTFREEKARAVRPILREQLEIASRWAARRALGGQRLAGPRV
ncbi:MAG: N-formylglutamate deformylase [Usitatibacter sp.]